MVFKMEKRGNREMVRHTAGEPGDVLKAIIKNVELIGKKLRLKCMARTR
jgi:hypothetical protein